MSTLFQSALAAHDAGLSVVPIMNDGTKRPPFKWGEYQTEQADIALVRTWFKRGAYTGFALICGPVSNNLEVLDFDDADTYEMFCDTAESLGLDDLVDRLRAGYAERTPSGGVHLPYYCETISGNTKLARRSDKEVLIETRGIGGYFIAAPSNGSVHPNGGAWTIISGGLDSIATITAEERELLFQLARSFDQVPPVDAQDDPRASTTLVGGLRPGDDFKQQHGSVGSFASIVEPHGWKLTHRRGNVGYFRRPGKDDGWSATFNHADSGLFYVFSSSTDFEAERGYNPFSVYALLNHKGDFREAATELVKKGYGKKASVSLGSVKVGKKTEKQQSHLAAFRPTELPAESVYGWFAEYLDHVEPTTESPNSFHMAAALTIVGACIGKRVGLFHASDRLYPNFYTLLIGPSGRSRKDTAIRRMLDMFYAIPPRGEPLIATQVPFRVVRDISSAEGLIATVKENANTVFYTSEFAKLMNNAGRESTRSIGPLMIEAFDCPPSLQNNTVASIEDKKPREAKDPFVSVLSTVQPEILAEVIGSQQQYSGFLNRWLLVVGDGKAPRPNPPRIDTDRSWRLIRRLIDTIRSYPENHILEFDDDAADRWSEWYVDSYPTGNESAQEDAMGIRRGTMVKKIALVHAVTDSSKVVTLDHLNRGIAFSDWSWQHTKRLLPMWGETKHAELERKILENLTAIGSPTRKREMQRKVASKLGPGVFAGIVKSMVENDDIVVLENGTIALKEWIEHG